MKRHAYKHIIIWPTVLWNTKSGRKNRRNLVFCYLLEIRLWNYSWDVLDNMRGDILYIYISNDINGFNNLSIKGFVLVKTGSPLCITCIVVPKDLWIISVKVYSVVLFELDFELGHCWKFVILPLFFLKGECTWIY